ncbi:hypothetical protein CGLAMM_03980 [Acetobacteraceae bacterium EV16G]
MAAIKRGDLDNGTRDENSFKVGSQEKIAC